MSTKGTNTITETERRYIREVSRAFVRELQEQGHICLHAEDWGVFKQAVNHNTGKLKALDGKLDVLDGKLDALDRKMIVVNTERRVAGWIVNIIVGLVGAVCGAKVFGK